MCSDVLSSPVLGVTRRQMLVVTLSAQKFVFSNYFEFEPRLRLQSQIDWNKNVTSDENFLKRIK